MMDMKVMYTDGTTEDFKIYTGVSTAFWLVDRLQKKKQKRVIYMELDDGKNIKWKHSFFIM